MYSYLPFSVTIFMDLQVRSTIQSYLLHSENMNVKRSFFKAEYFKCGG